MKSIRSMIRRALSLTLGGALLLTLAACHERDLPLEVQAERSNGEGEELTLQLTLVDGAGTEQLLLAGEREVYMLSTRELPVTLDGEPAGAETLEDGMTLRITCGGVEETYPAGLTGVSEVAAFRRGTAEEPGGSCWDLCGLYLQVLRDLWDDEGSGSVAVELSQAPGLTEGEGSAIAWQFAAQAGRELCSLESLAPGDSCLTITAADWEEEEFYSLPVVKFHAEYSQRMAAEEGTLVSGRGFRDCFAVWPEMGSWSDYQVGSEYLFCG